MLASLALSSTLMTPTALAENFNYTDEQIKVDFVYDDDHVGKGRFDGGTYELVIITNLETGEYVVVGFDQLDGILEQQSGEVLNIDGKEFSKEGVLTARNTLQTKIEEKEAKYLLDGKIALTLFATFGFIILLGSTYEKKGRIYGYNTSGDALKEFIYNIRRGFWEDKSRRQFTKYIKIK
ncbi:MAG: hypothetical protein IKF82_05570 [Bacilli bacterium]|nr:hypothetical protein [Bacilli bacterium]